MKNINKYTAAIIFAILALGFFYSCAKESDHNTSQSKDDKIETRTSPLSVSCLDSLASGCTGELQIDTLNFNVEIYPGCIANISWIEYLCLEPSTGVILNVAFANVFGWPIPGQCDSTINSWNNFFNTGQYAKYNEAILQFQFDVEKAFTKKRMEQLLSLGIWPCSGNGAYLQSKLFKASCQFTYRLQCRSNEGQYNISLPYIGNCGESCCKSTIWWCTDTLGVPQPSLPLIEQIGSCTNTRSYPVAPSKFCKVVYEGDCIDQCNE